MRMMTLGRFRLCVRRPYTPGNVWDWAHGNKKSPYKFVQIVKEVNSHMHFAWTLVYLDIYSTKTFLDHPLFTPFLVLFDH